MSKDILHQVIADIKASPMKVSLQLDKDTGVCFCTVCKGEINDGILAFVPLTTTTNAIGVSTISS